MSYIWEKKSNFLVAEVHFLEEESSSSKGWNIFGILVCTKKGSSYSKFSHWRSHLAFSKMKFQVEESKSFLLHASNGIQRFLLHDANGVQRVQATTLLRWAIVVGETFSRPCVFSSFPCNFLLNMLHVTSEGFKPGLLFGLPLVGYHSIFTISATNCRIII